MKRSPRYYFYGVIETDEEKKINSVSGLERGKIELIGKENISAVVSLMKKEEMDISRSTFFDYENIIERLRERADTFLPASFGTVIEDKKGLLKKLKKNQKRILEEADYLKGKSEIHLKSAWLDFNFALKKMIEKDKNFSLIYQRSNQVTSGLGTIEVGREFFDAVQGKREDLKREMMDSLQGLVIKEKQLPIVADEMIFNSVLLVDLKNKKLITKKIEIMKKNWKKKNIFIGTGNFYAPYHFVRISV